MSFLSIINEAKSDVFGSKEGTKGRNRAGVTKSQKSRVKVYPSIMSALRAGQIGDIFSTDGSERLYVISKQKWGTDKDQVVAGRIAKGFTPGSATPSASWPSIKKHSVRTKLRYRKGSVSRDLKRKYGSRIKIK
jgi:hypothetical protein